VLKALGATALTAFPLPSFGAVGANEQVRLGVIGCGQRGADLAQQFSRHPGTKVVAVCDPDTQPMAALAKKLGQGREEAPRQVQDYRKLLEMKDVDAVIIASPHYWHALHTIHACQAGKDVYVEKPVNFHLGESAPMIAAAEKYRRIVQAGTQNRSDKGLIEAFAAIRAGEFGRILSVRGLCYRHRESIGRRDTPLVPPKTLDYNLWLGPAQDLPIMRPRLHYDWHWDWNTGNGDIGNQGPHEMDLISWVLGDKGLPSSVRCFGGRFAWNDAGNTANLQTAWFELAGVPVIFEVNNLRIRPDLNGAPAFKSIRVGVIVTCEAGEFRGGRGGGYVVRPGEDKPMRKFPGDAGGGHNANFIDAIRSRRAADLRGNLATSCTSSSLSHLANISLRAGQPTPQNELRRQIPGSAEMQALLEAQEKQLQAWSVDLASAPYTLGAEVTVDPVTGRVTGALASSEIVIPVHRKGFELPEVI
jgi:hypothetical protein